MIPQYEPYYEPEVIEAVNKYMRDGGWCTEGPKTKEFEGMIQDYLGVKHAICVCNGTMGLYLACKTVLLCGEVVLTPETTMPATWNAVKLADNEIKCSDNKLLDGIDYEICVSLNGILKPWRVSKDFIEDACQSFGSKHAGQFIGTFGEIGVFSFGPHKIISTGQGGCVVTNNDRHANLLRSLKDHDKINAYKSFGINAKFNDIAAVMGIEQLKNIEWRINRKREIASWYGIDTGPWWVPWMFEYDCESVHNVQKVRKHLLNDGIETREYYYDYHGNPSTKIWLPSSLTLTKDQVDHVKKSLALL